MNGQFPYSTEGDLQRYHQICHLLDQTLEATHMLIQVKFKSQSNLQKQPFNTITNFQYGRFSNNIIVNTLIS